MLFTDTWNSNFDAAPDGSTVAANTLDTVIATTKKAVRERFAVEHNLSLTNSADQGTHQAGSAVVYYQDEAPTTRPSGDDLDSDDAGRVWIDSDDGTVDYYDGSDWQSITTPASTTTEGIVETGDGGATLKPKVIEIGDWNMDVTTTVSVAHGLTFANIRSVDAFVRNDDNTFYASLQWASTGGAGGIAWDTTDVALSRANGGVFDTTSYNSTTYNRGYITIWYVEE